MLKGIQIFIFKRSLWETVSGYLTAALDRLSCQGHRDIKPPLGPPVTMLLQVVLPVITTVAPSLKNAAFPGPGELQVTRLFPRGQSVLTLNHFFLNMEDFVMGLSLRDSSSSFILKLVSQDLSCIFYPNKYMWFPRDLFYHIKQ